MLYKDWWSLILKSNQIIRYKFFNDIIDQTAWSKLIMILLSKYTYIENRILTNNFDYILVRAMFCKEYNILF
jgi:hypothetical protein